MVLCVAKRVARPMRILCCILLPAARAFIPPPQLMRWQHVSAHASTSSRATIVALLDVNDWGSKIGELFGGRQKLAQDMRGASGGGKGPVDEEPESEWKRYELGSGGRGPPSMDDLWREAWKTQACQDLMQLREDMNIGEGHPHVDILVRPFGENSTIYNVFYRDSAAWDPQCQSVWMMLEEKQLPYKVKKVNLVSYGEKPDWFFQVAPSGLMPVVEVEGRIVRETVEILKFIDWWPGSKNPRSMYPAKDSPLYQVAEDLLVLERELYMNWFIYVFESPEAKGKQPFLDTLGKIETALGAYEGPWFLGGEEPSLVDLLYAPWLERVVVSLLYWKAMQIRPSTTYPNINRFLDTLDKRPSYAAYKADYYNIAQNLQPQYGRAYGVPAAKAFQDAIDGTAPGAWSFDPPQSPLSSIVDYMAPGTEPPPHNLSRQTVAAKLIIAHRRVPRYMLRALGQAGPQYNAPLSDPYNEPNAKMQGEIDVAYRYLILALLRGADAVEVELMADIEEADKAYGDRAAKARKRVARCLEYLRARVGVPRDFGLWEARELRAHLTWMINVFRGEGRQSYISPTLSLDGR